MAAALRGALLLTAFALVVVESPWFKPPCHHEEYLDSGGHCCKLCPAGTHVDESCIKPHTHGTCARCHEGIDYTDRANGLNYCFRCTECNSGFEMVKSCTLTSDTECRCKAGYYCPPSCEECVRCKTKCPEGQVPVQQCNATADMRCGPPTETKDATSLYISITTLGISTIFLGAIAFCCWKSTRNGFCQSDEEKSPQSCLGHCFQNHCGQQNPGPNGASSESLLASRIEQPGSVSKSSLPGNAGRSDLAASNTNEEPPLESTVSPSPLQVLEESPDASLQPNLKASRQQPVIVVVAENPDSVKVLNEIYFDSRGKVSLRDWKDLMRKSGLEDNEIDKIVRDHPWYTDEQHYQMLKTLQNRYGIKDALLKLLNGIWAMKLTITYENLTNELRSKGIITLETKD